MTSNRRRRERRAAPRPTSASPPGELNLPPRLPPRDKPYRAVEFARQSSLEQEGSIEKQERGNSKLAKANHCKILFHFDYSRSAWKDDPFGELISYFEDTNNSKGVEVVISTSTSTTDTFLDRPTRKVWEDFRSDLVRLLNMDFRYILTDKGVVEIEKLLNDDEYAKPIIERIEAAHQHSLLLSQQMKAVHATAAELDQPPPGRIPYGLKRGKRGWIHGDPKEIRVVKRIFRERHEMRKPKPLNRIASDLNRDGIPSPGGKKWSDNGVNGILEHPELQALYRSAIQVGESNKAQDRFRTSVE